MLIVCVQKEREETCTILEINLQFTLPLVLPNGGAHPLASNKALQSVIEDGRHSLRIPFSDIRPAGKSVTDDEYKLEIPH